MNKRSTTDNFDRHKRSIHKKGHLTAIFCDQKKGLDTIENDKIMSAFRDLELIGRIPLLIPNFQENRHEEERGTIFLTTFPSAPHHHHHHARHPPQSLGELRKTTFPFGRRNSTPWLFFKSPKSSAHASGAWRHSHPAVTFSIWGFYCEVSGWHVCSARAWTPTLVFAPN